VIELLSKYIHHFRPEKGSPRGLDHQKCEKSEEATGQTGVGMVVGFKRRKAHISRQGGTSAD